MLAWQAIDRTHRIGQLRPVTAVRWLSWRVKFQLLRKVCFMSTIIWSMRAYMHECNRFIMADSIEERVLALQVHACVTYKQDTSTKAHTCAFICIYTSALTNTDARTCSPGQEEAGMRGNSGLQRRRHGAGFACWFLAMYLVLTHVEIRGWGFRLCLGTAFNIHGGFFISSVCMDVGKDWYCVWCQRTHSVLLCRLEKSKSIFFFLSF